MKQNCKIQYDTGQIVFRLKEPLINAPNRFLYKTDIAVIIARLIEQRLVIIICLGCPTSSGVGRIISVFLLLGALPGSLNGHLPSKRDGGNH